jgi:hypothetical protein
MTAGMGQLLALESIVLGPDGQSLLSQTKALSTVSGGSWVGTPFTYLPPGTSDTDFLGGPYTAPSSLTAAGLASLPAGCVAANCTSAFSLLDIAACAFVMYEMGTPADMLWQILIGLHFLAPYGLYRPTSSTNLVPAGYFSYDAATVATIRSANKGSALATEAADTVAQVSGQARPFHVCNMAMAVDGNALLAPVQGTPFFTGIVSSPGATDADGRPVGGGGVTSFAFSSAPATVDAPSVSVQQPRQWTLTDITGTSSAAFAEALIATFARFAASPPRFAAALRASRPAVQQVLGRAGIPAAKIDATLDARIAAVHRGDLAAHRKILALAPVDLVPAYQYWPITGVTGGETVTTSRFADAGSLDNTGIASVLSYADVDNVIAFINTETLLSEDARSVVVVDDDIPPLFGFQPYDAALGYVPYSQPLVKPANAVFANNQVFPGDAFATLLAQLWAASGSGSYQNSPVVRQPLTTVANKWFGVTGGKAINVLWVYLENTLAWSSQLSAEVADIEAQLVSQKGFPHYGTFDTQLTPTEVNLLANLAAWTVTSNQGLFTAMYEGAAPLR